MPNDQIEIVLTPKDDEVGPGDDEWAEDLESLRDGLAGTDLDVREETTNQSGHKGAVTDIIVALGGSGTVAALIAVLRVWVDGRQTRSLRMTARGRSAVTVDMRAKGLTEETMRTILLDAIARSERDA